MRGDSSRQLRTDGASGEGRNSPIVQSNGSSFPGSTETSLHSHILNGTTPHARTNSFSYSSVLASTATAQTPSQDGGNGISTNHDKPFKYSKDEMLNIWKNNAAKYRNNGIPLEFEKHEIFTSDETLDPILLTEMTPAEQEVVAIWILIDIGIFGSFEFR
jgi:hypothetical protein